MNNMHVTHLHRPGGRQLILAAAVFVGLASVVPAQTQSDLVASFLERAAAAEKSGDAIAAENCYELALRVKPGDPGIMARLTELKKKFPPPDLLTLPVGLITPHRGNLDGLLAQVVERVKRKSYGRLGLQFIFDDPTGSLRKSEPPIVSLNDNAPLKEVLNAVTSILGCSWEIKGGTVVLKSREALAARSAAVVPVPPKSTKAQPAPLAAPPDSSSQGSVTASDAVVTVSYHAAGESPAAINDGVAPATAGAGGARVSWKPHVGTLEWVELRFPTPRPIAGCEVFWAVADTEHPTVAERLRLPDYWKVLYENEAGEWWPVVGNPGIPSAEGGNTCRFSVVKTACLRLMVQIGSAGSSGIHEWRVIPGPAAVTQAARPTELRMDEVIPVNAVVGFKSFRVNKYSLTEEKKGARVLLNGQPCERFLYAHATSSVTYAVPAGFSRFSAVGIAPTQILKPSWTYKVLGDGASIFESKQLKEYPGNQVPIEVELPSGCRTLTLVTDSAGNGNADHSIWAEPVLKRDSAAPLTWLSADGKSLVAPFVRVEGDTVVVLKDGKELKIPLARLNAESVKQARALGGATAATIKPSAATEAKEPVVKPVPPAPGEPTPADEKLSSMARLRKLCEKVIAISPSGLRIVIDRRVLPQNSLPLPPGTFDIAEMNIGGASAAGFTDADFELLSAGRSATAVAVNDTAVTKLDALKSHRGLTSLSAEQTRIDDTALAALEPLRELTKVMLNRSMVAGSGLHYLRSCSKLQSLGLSGCPITDDAMPDVAGMRSLEVLWMGTTKVTEAGLKQLAGHPKLRELNLDGLALQDGGLDFVPSLRSLSALSFYTSNLSRGAFKKIGEAGALEILVLNGTHIDGAPVADTDLSALAAASKLNRLLLSSTAVTGTGFASLSKCRALKHVDVGGSTPVSDEGLAVMTATVPGLEQLVIGGSLTAKGLAEVAKWRQLTELQISSETMDDVTVGALPGMRSLRRLELHGVKMGVQAAAAAGRQSSLTSLNVSGTSFDDSAIPHLSRLGTLKELVVGKCPFTEDGLSKLRRALPNCTVIR